MNLASEKSAPGYLLYWLIICMTVTVIMVPNLHLWPLILQDEVQILDHGRVLFELSSDWGMSWLVHEERPLAGTAYLGSAIQELAYKLTAPSNFSPRLLSFIGALLASGILFNWLVKRKIPRGPALVCATIFLLDPIFNESYRQARVDSWAFAAVFSSCWLIRAGLDPLRSSVLEPKKVQVFFSGALAAISPFIWPTAVALFPFIALELVTVLKPTSIRKYRAKAIKYFILGGTAGLSIAVIPLLFNFEHFLTSFIEGMHIQSVASYFKRSLIDMAMLSNPWVIPLVISALLLKRNYGLILALGTTLAMMSQTMIYPMRLLYLLPFLILMVAEGFEHATNKPQIRWRAALLYCMASLVLMWNIAISVVERPLIAELQKDVRSHTVILDALSAEIGAGPHEVLLIEWEPYFAARALGWKSYKVFGQYNKSHPEFLEFLGRMDYVIIRNNYLFMKEVTPERLIRSGFEQVATVSFGRAEANHWILKLLNSDPPGTIYEDLLVFKNEHSR